jgi:hypothetical protein
VASIEPTSFRGSGTPFAVLPTVLQQGRPQEKSLRKPLGMSDRLERISREKKYLQLQHSPEDLSKVTNPISSPSKSMKMLTTFAISSPPLTLNMLKTLQLLQEIENAECADYGRVMSEGADRIRNAVTAINAQYTENAYHDRADPERADELFFARTGYCNPEDQYFRTSLFWQHLQTGQDFMQLQSNHLQDSQESASEQIHHAEMITTLSLSIDQGARSRQLTDIVMAPNKFSGFNRSSDNAQTHNQLHNVKPTSKLSLAPIASPESSHQHAPMIETTSAALAWSNSSRRKHPRRRGIRSSAHNLGVKPFWSMQISKRLLLRGISSGTTGQSLARQRRQMQTSSHARIHPVLVESLSMQSPNSTSRAAPATPVCNARQQTIRVSRMHRTFRILCETTPQLQHVKVPSREHLEN